MLLTCDKIARKRQSSKEVWHKFFGTINARRECHDVRLELAKHEWARLKSNDSLECRNCHSSVASSKQTQRAAEIHTRFVIFSEATCIDCRKGIAHELPNMERVDPGSACYRNFGAINYLRRRLSRTQMPRLSFHGNTIECTTQSRWSKLTHRPVAQAYLR